eukprot:7387725-Prymnesium_polylepis.1
MGSLGLSCCEPGDCLCEPSRRGPEPCAPPPRGTDGALRAACVAHCERRGRPRLRLPHEARVGGRAAQGGLAR